MRLILQDGSVDLARRVVERGGQTVRLTTMEARLLEHLARADGEAVSPDTLLVEVWGYGDGVQSRTVRTTVGRLRRKLEADPRAPQVLCTDTGFGYRLVVGSVEDPTPASAPSLPRPSPARSPEPAVAAAPPPGRAALVDGVEAALSQGPVALTGAPGAGRTRLALCLAERAAARGVGVCMARCDAGRGPVEAAAAALGLHAPPAAQAVAVGRALAERSVGLLVLLGAGPPPAAPLAAWRAAAPHTSVLVAGGAAPPDARAVHVPPLETEPARAVLAAAWADAGPAPDPAAVRAVVDAVGGLPLALRLAAHLGAMVGPDALLAALRDDGVGSVASPALRAALVAARGALPPADAAALDALGTFGSPFSAAEARAVAPSATLATLARLVRHGLIEPADGDGRLRILPPIRAALEVPAAARAAHAQALARRCAPLLVRLDGADEAGALAALEALRPGLAEALSEAPLGDLPAEIPRALLELDCRRAGSVAVGAAAERWLDARMGAPGWGTVAALQARSLRRGGVSPAVRARIDARLDPPVGTAVERAWMIEERLRACVESGGAAGAKPLLDASLAAAEACGDPVRRSESLQSAALLQRAWGDLPAAIQAGRAGVAQADLGGGRGLRAIARRTLADMQVDSGDLDEAMAHAGDAQALLAGLGQGRTEAALGLTLGRLHWLRGDPDAADAALARSAARSAAVGSPRTELLATWRRAVQAVNADRPADALARLDQVDALMATFDDRSLLASALVTRGNALLSAGEPERALTAHAAAVAMQQERGGALYVASAQVCGARSALAAGELARAESWATDGAATMAAAGLHEVAADALGLAALARRDPAAAAAVDCPTPMASLRRACVCAALGGPPLSAAQHADAADRASRDMALRFVWRLAGGPA